MISLPNTLTFFNMMCGLAAIRVSMTGNWAGACQLVLACVFFDSVDGWTARRFHQETRFGAFFDSAADFISFGLAPVFIFHAARGNIGMSVILGLGFYVTASAFRLIRFHFEKQAIGAGTFQGLPTTASALIFVSSIWLAPSPWTLWILSLLMISRIPFTRLFS